MFTTTTRIVALVLWVASLGCVDTGRSIEPPLQPVVRLPDAPAPPPVEVLPAPPLLQYAEPLPLPPAHVVRVALEPSGAKALGLVQRVVVEVDVTGGATGRRPVQAVFVSPQGLAWEQQSTEIDMSPGATVVARFTLPVAATFIEDHHLAGAWQVTTLDEGAERATSGFTLEE